MADEDLVGIALQLERRLHPEVHLGQVGLVGIRHEPDHPQVGDLVGGVSGVESRALDDVLRRDDAGDGRRERERLRGLPRPLEPLDFRPPERPAAQAFDGRRGPGAPSSQGTNHLGDGGACSSDEEILSWAVKRLGAEEGEQRLSPGDGLAHEVDEDMLT